MSNTRNMYMSLTQAAQNYNIGKGTISKALSSGKLSYVSRTEDGYEIDPSEMDRFMKTYKRRRRVSNKGVSSNKEPLPISKGATIKTHENNDTITILLQKNDDISKENKELQKKLFEKEIDFLKQNQELQSKLLLLTTSQKSEKSTFTKILFLLLFLISFTALYLAL